MIPHCDKCSGRTNSTLLACLSQGASKFILPRRLFDHKNGSHSTQGHGNKIPRTFRFFEARQPKNHEIHGFHGSGCTFSRFHVFTYDGARKFTQFTKFTFSRFSRCTKFTKFTFSRFHVFHGARNSRNSRFHVFTFFTVHEIHVFMFSRFRAHEKFTKFTFSCFFTFHPLCMRRPCEGLRNLKKQSGSFQHVIYIYILYK